VYVLKMSAWERYTAIRASVVMKAQYVLGLWMQEKSDSNVVFSR